MEDFGAKTQAIPEYPEKLKLYLTVSLSFNSWSKVLFSPSQSQHHQAMLDVP